MGATCFVYSRAVSTPCSSRIRPTFRNQQQQERSISSTENHEVFQEVWHKLCSSVTQALVCRANQQSIMTISRASCLHRTGHDNRRERHIGLSSHLVACMGSSSQHMQYGDISAGQQSRYQTPASADSGQACCEARVALVRASRRIPTSRSSLHVCVSEAWCVWIHFQHRSETPPGERGLAQTEGRTPSDGRFVTAQTAGHATSSCCEGFLVLP